MPVYSIVYYVLQILPRFYPSSNQPHRSEHIVEKCECRNYLKLRYLELDSLTLKSLSRKNLEIICAEKCY